MDMFVCINELQGGRDLSATAEALDPSPWLTIPELAARWKESSQNVRNRIQRGQIRSYALPGSRRLLISREEIEQIEGGLQLSTPGSE